MQWKRFWPEKSERKAIPWEVWAVWVIDAAVNVSGLFSAWRYLNANGVIIAMVLLAAVVIWSWGFLGGYKLAAAAKGLLLVYQASYWPWGSLLAIIQAYLMIRSDSRKFFGWETLWKGGVKR